MAMPLEDHNRFVRTQDAYRENDPPVEVNQFWVARNAEGEILRKVRILARHPDTIDDKRVWITRDEPVGKLGTDHYMRDCPEFNLRYVFELEQQDAS